MNPIKNNEDLKIKSLLTLFLIQLIIIFEKIFFYYENQYMCYAVSGNLSKYSYYKNTITIQDGTLLSQFSIFSFTFLPIYIYLLLILFSIFNLKKLKIIFNSFCQQYQINTHIS